MDENAKLAVFAAIVLNAAAILNPDPSAASVVSSTILAGSFKDRSAWLSSERTIFLLGTVLFFLVNNKTLLYGTAKRISSVLDYI